jgi:hypothetical protein
MVVQHTFVAVEVRPQCQKALYKPEYAFYMMAACMKGSLHPGLGAQYSKNMKNWVISVWMVQKCVPRCPVAQ